jgi:hypothetical protein
MRLTYHIVKNEYLKLITRGKIKKILKKPITNRTPAFPIRFICGKI